MTMGMLTPARMPTLAPLFQIELMLSGRIEFFLGQLTTGALKPERGTRSHHYVPRHFVSFQIRCSFMLYYGRNPYGVTNITDRLVRHQGQ